MNQQWSHAAFLPAADPGYQLPPAAHERLHRLLNATAFQALLARLKPGPRSELLETTLELATLGKITFGPMFSDVIDDPEITELFQNVTRPFSREG